MDSFGNSHHDLQTKAFGNNHHDLQTNGFGNNYGDLQTNGFGNTHHDLQTNGFGNNHHDLQTNGCEVASPLDLQELRRQGHMMIDFIVDYYQNIGRYPVLSQVEPGYLQKRLPDSAPNSPEPIETILQDVQQHIIPGLTHWQSPNFFAYFPANASVAGFLGDALISAFNVVGFSWVASPAATELEVIVMDWLGKMLQLPQSFLFSGNGGVVMHGTTCEAVLSTLVAARDQFLRKNGNEKIGSLVVYASEKTHSTAQKAARITGINPENFRIIKTTISTSFALSPEALQKAIEEDLNAGLIPLYLCATVGTTSTCAVDPIGPLCDVAKEHGIWVHVDAAYGGNACVCPEFRHFLDGIEGANSFSLNAHKWFFTNALCCCLWVKDPSALTKSLSTNPEYLKNKATESAKVVDYKDWQIPLSRRFRAIKLWLVLRSYGVTNLRSFLLKHVKMAERFEQLVRGDTRFEVVVRRNFALVCFRVRPSALGAADVGEEYANEFNEKLLSKINESGKVFMTHAKVGGVFMIRCSIGNSLTEEMHVINAWEVVQNTATAIQHAK